MRWINILNRFSRIIKEKNTTISKEKRKSEENKENNS